MPHPPTWRIRLPLSGNQLKTCLAEVALPSDRSMLTQLFSSLMDGSPLIQYKMHPHKQWRYQWGCKGLLSPHDIVNMKKELQQNFGGGNEGKGGVTLHCNKYFRTYPSGMRMSHATQPPNHDYQKFEYTYNKGDFWCNCIIWKWSEEHSDETQRWSHYLTRLCSQQQTYIFQHYLHQVHGHRI